MTVDDDRHDPHLGQAMLVAIPLSVALWTVIFWLVFQVVPMLLDSLYREVLK